jgi:hypothetical protein
LAVLPLCFTCVYVLYWLFFRLVLPVYLRYISCSRVQLKGRTANITPIHV